MNNKLILRNGDDSKEIICELDIETHCKFSGQDIPEYALEKTYKQVTWNLSVSSGNERPAYYTMRAFVERFLTATFSAHNSMRAGKKKNAILNTVWDNNFHAVANIYLVKGEKEIPITITVDSAQDGRGRVYSFWDAPYAVLKVNRREVKTKDLLVDGLVSILLKVGSPTFDIFRVDSKFVRESFSLSDSVKYALVNRTKYKFYYVDNEAKDIKRRDVLLNIKRISDTECAMEISQDVWGSISNEDLDSFIKAQKGTNHKKWGNISPRKLFIETVGREPSRAEIDLMVNFLMQNRTDKIVSDRAFQMFNEIVGKNKDKIFIDYKLDEEGNRLEVSNDFSHISGIYVRGMKIDWKINAKSEGRGSNRQMVNVMSFIPRDNSYSNPICIDNTNTNSPLGDQIATRILATMNDEIMMSRVSTVQGNIRNGGRDGRIIETENGLHRGTEIHDDGEEE